MSGSGRKPSKLFQIGRWVGPIVLAFCAVAGLAVAMGAGDKGWGQSWRWLGPAVTSRLFLTCAAILVLCAVLLVVLCTAMWRIGASNRASPGRGEKGSAMVEFMLVLPLALTLVLVMVQSAVLMAGNLCVHYAAYCAARSAVVNVPTDLNDQNLNSIANQNRGSYQSRIETAAYYAVMPFSCGSAELPANNIPLQAGLDRFFQLNNTPTPGWAGTQLGRKWRYAQTYTTVELVTVDQVRSLKDWQAHAPLYKQNEDVTVRVSHTFYLAVPFARKLFALGNDGVTLNLGAAGAGADYGTIIRATCTMSNEGAQDFVDVEQFPK